MMPLPEKALAVPFVTGGDLAYQEISHMAAIPFQPDAVVNTARQDRARVSTMANPPVHYGRVAVPQGKSGADVAARDLPDTVHKPLRQADVHESHHGFDARSSLDKHPPPQLGGSAVETWSHGAWHRVIRDQRRGLKNQRLARCVAAKAA